MYYAKNNKSEFDVTAHYKSIEDLWDFILWGIPGVNLFEWDFYNSDTDEAIKFPCDNERCSAMVQHPESPCEECDY